MEETTKIATGLVAAFISLVFLLLKRVFFQLRLDWVD